MVLLKTPNIKERFKAPDFSLPGTDGKTYSRLDCLGKKGLLVMFICNHCPYVKATIERLVEDYRYLEKKGIGSVAIMSNDTAAYPADSFDNMKIFAKEHNFCFPYLIDETQEVARAYGAVCTPDLFGFNADGYLEYRGRVDSAGMNDAAPPDIQHEMREATLEIAETGYGPAEQIPSMGCSIKWKE